MKRSGTAPEYGGLAGLRTPVLTHLTTFHSPPTITGDMHPVYGKTAIRDFNYYVNKPGAAYTVEHQDRRWNALLAHSR